MLEIRIHCPGNDRYQPVSGTNPAIDLSSGDVLPAGDHGLVKLIALPADFEAILDEELEREGRGKLMLSGTRENRLIQDLITIE
jgi:hypothetical protein